MSKASDKKGSRAGHSKDRDRSRSPIRGENSGELMSIDDLKKVVADAIAAQLPTVIIEASKVARAALTVDREENAREMAAELRKLKQDHEDLALTSKASILKSEGAI